MTTTAQYAVVTPVRDEAESLPRLAESLAAQTSSPETWVVVENGSTDETAEIAHKLASRHRWIRVVDAAAGPEGERARPIVLAFQAGIAALSPRPQFIAKVDADVTLPPEYFEGLLEKLDTDRILGVVSGTCFEQHDGAWLERFGTGSSVWGAARVYRWTCLEQLLPLENRTAWDWIDVAEANVRGWRTAVARDQPFYHHRREGDRARTRWAQWSSQGYAAHYLGYRPSYLLVRALYRSLRDPAALALVSSYAGAALLRQERCRKTALVEHVREQQLLRNLTRRATEALGRDAATR